MSHQANNDRVMQDAAVIVQRLRNTDVRIVTLMKEYGVGYYCLVRAIVSQIGQDEYRGLVKSHCGPKPKQVWVKCSQCDVMVRRPLSKTRRVFCSRRCQGLSLRTGALLRCSYCHRLFYRQPSHAKRTESGVQFCSRSHAKKYHNAKAGILPQRLLKCDNPHCGRAFLRDESGITPYAKHYCSTACAGAVNRDQMTVACSECGRLIERPPSEYLSYLHHFCDKACKSRWEAIYGGPGQLSSNEQVCRELRIICKKIEFCREYDGRMQGPSFYKLLQQMSRRLTQWMQTAGLMDRELKDTVAQTLRRVRKMI